MGHKFGRFFATCDLVKPNEPIFYVLPPPPSSWPISPSSPPYRHTHARTHTCYMHAQTRVVAPSEPLHGGGKKGRHEDVGRGVVRTFVFHRQSIPLPPRPIFVEEASTPTICCGVFLAEKWGNPPSART